MKLALSIALLALPGFALAGAVLAARSGLPEPPATRVEPVADSWHGVEILDPYRWLEGDNSNRDRMGAVTPEVAGWTDAQNAYTRSVLDALPGRAALEARLRPLMEIGAVTTPRVRGERHFFTRRDGKQNQPVVYCRDGHHGESRVLLDPARLDPSGSTTVVWFSPSADGELLAYGTYRAGDENSTLRVLRVATGEALALEIPNKTQSPDWLPDGSGFVYQNLSDPDDPYSGQVLFHRMGEDPARDPVLFRQYTRAENEKLATTWGPGAALSRDGRWLVLVYWTGTRSNDLWVADFEAYRRTGRLEKREVLVGADGNAFGQMLGDTLLVHTTVDAPNGQVLAVDPRDPRRERWRVLVPERRDAVVQSVGVAKGVVTVEYLKNAVSAFELFDADGKPLGELALPGLGSAELAVEPDRTTAFLGFTSFNYPRTIFRVDLAQPRAAPELWERPEVPVDPALAEVRQVWFPSKDGTPVSMFVVHRKGLALDGDNPTLLTGYGGFNVPSTPAFKATLFPWLEDGGVFALPNLRGGGEYGDAWHEAGMLERKQNVFDDFVAAAEWLIANRYTSRERLAIEGGSNGGLLTGAAVTQRPDLFGAAIVAVPLLDMLRYQNFLMARYWVPEYGSAEQPDQFRYLHAYSPYHRVRDGVRYPAVFLTAGENDVRVHALHARKMAARLQAVAAGVENAEPVLLWVDREAGHGQGKPLDLRLRDEVDESLFVRWQLGLLPRAAGTGSDAPGR